MIDWKGEDGGVRGPQHVDRPPNIIGLFLSQAVWVRATVIRRRRVSALMCSCLHPSDYLVLEFRGYVENVTQAQLSTRPQPPMHKTADLVISPIPTRNQSLYFLSIITAL
jgi:hypothetical protein